MTDLFGDSAPPAQALARKWRPRAFADMKGQEHAVRALANALTQGRLHHAYLLTGTRGVGKTTLARIMAKCLNCETGVTAEPCGVCPACTQIDAGRFVDLIELDAASNTGVDNMREVLDNAQYAPTAGRFKVYIIDEVHMLSKSAFNSMLKTLEEPPAHVKFILATTDPQKIPVTVLSRCLQFNLKPMTPALVAQHLGEVLAAEGVETEPAALNLLARAAAGSMRDALSLTDQAIAYGSGAVRAAEVDTMLGTVKRDYLFDLLDALAAKDGDALMAHAQALAERGIAFDAALQDFAQLLTQLAVQLHAPGALEDVVDAARLAEAATALDPETAQLYYQIALAGRRDLPYAPDEYAGFCMTLLRMLAFAPGAADAPAGGRTTTQGAAVPRPAAPRRAAEAYSTAVTASPAPSAAEPAPARPAMAKTSAAKAPTVPRPAPAAVEADDPFEGGLAPWDDEYDAAPVRAPAAAPEIGSPRAEPPRVESQASKVVESAAEAMPSPATPAAPVTLSGDWDWHTEAARLTGLAKMLGEVCELVKNDASGITLRIDHAHKHLLDRMYQEKLVTALRARHGQGLQITFESGAPATSTPQQTRTRVRAERQAEAVEAIESDPFVQSLIADFGGRVEPASIQPLGDPS